LRAQKGRSNLRVVREALEMAAALLKPRHEIRKELYSPRRGEIIDVISVL